MRPPRASSDLIVEWVGRSYMSLAHVAARRSRAYLAPYGGPPPCGRVVVGLRAPGGLSGLQHGDGEDGNNACRNPAPAFSRSLWPAGRPLKRPRRV